MGIGFLELVIIGVAALVLLGPKRLPEVMRQVARFYVQVRRTSNDFKSAFDHVVREAEDEVRREVSPLQKLAADQFLTQTESKEPHLKSPPQSEPESKSVAPSNAQSVSNTETRPAGPFAWEDSPCAIDPVTQKPPST
jgi:sec-independent protein translocase protein TatB